MWAVGGLSHLGDLMFCQKTSAWDLMHEQVHCHDEAANHQLPIAAAFRIIWIVSKEECSSLTQNLMHIRCSIGSFIWWVMATQYTCSLQGINCPHWLVQWSCHCSHMCIPVHFPWLPGYTDIVQTILVISAMAGLFLDRLYVCVCVCVYIWYHIYMRSYICVCVSKWICHFITKIQDFNIS